MTGNRCVAVSFRVPAQRRLWPTCCQPAFFAKPYATYESRGREALWRCLRRDAALFDQRLFATILHGVISAAASDAWAAAGCPPPVPLPRYPPPRVGDYLLVACSRGLLGTDPSKNVAQAPPGRPPHFQRRREFPILLHLINLGP